MLGADGDRFPIGLTDFVEQRVSQDRRRRFIACRKDGRDAQRRGVAQGHFEW
jgi:hypothetical protein